MDIVSIFGSVLEQGLKLWNTKESRKYLDQYLGLMKDRYEEKSKSDPDMSRLDNIEHELWLLGRAFVADASGQKPENPSG